MNKQQEIAITNHCRFGFETAQDKFRQIVTLGGFRDNGDVWFYTEEEKAEG